MKPIGSWTSSTACRGPRRPRLSGGGCPGDRRARRRSLPLGRGSCSYRLADAHPGRRPRPTDTEEIRSPGRLGTRRVDMLIATLEVNDPDKDLWAWGSDKKARFWGRRMLFETTIHRADIELALGRDPTVETATALDGIDEFLDNLPHASYFAPDVNKLRNDGVVLRLRAGDAVSTGRSDSSRTASSGTTTQMPRPTPPCRAAQASCCCSSTRGAPRTTWRRSAIATLWTSGSSTRASEQPWKSNVFALSNDLTSIRPNGSRDRSHTCKTPDVRRPDPRR